MLKEKQCLRCKQVLPVENFGLNKRTGFTDYCKPCKNAYQKVYRQRNAAAVKQTKEIWVDKNRDRINLAARAKRYGMTREELTKFLSDFPNCAICGGRGQDIDHCHTSGQVRGHLCAPCNKGLGHFKDSAALLEVAANYLRMSK